MENLLEIKHEGDKELHKEKWTAKHNRGHNAHLKMKFIDQLEYFPAPVYEWWSSDNKG